MTRRTVGVVLFIFACVIKNALRRLLSSPAQLIPALVFLPLFFLGFGMAVAVLLWPSHEWEGLLAPHADIVRSSAMFLLVFAVFGLLHKAFEEDILAFHPAEVDFLFPAPLSKPLLVLAKTLKDYAFCALMTFLVVMYLIAPMRVLSPQTAGRAWALSSWGATFFFFVMTLNTGRLIQVLLVSRRTGGLAWAQAIRVLMVVLVAILVVGTILDRQHGRSPFESAVSLLSSRVLYWLFLPCGAVADVLMIPVAPEVSAWPRVVGLAAAALLSALLLRGFVTPLLEASLGATARRSAIWQAFLKGDAGAARAAQLAGRQVRGRSKGLPPIGRGAGALVAKALVVGLRSSPWAMVIVPAVALSPFAIMPAIEGRLTEEAERWLPSLLLYPIFMWSQGARITVRGELAHAAILKSLPISPFAAVAAMLTVPTVSFSAFITVFGVSGWAASSIVDGSLVTLILGVSPTLFAALASVQAVSALIYTGDEVGPGQSIVATLVFIPVSMLLLIGVIFAAYGPYSAGMGLGLAIILGNVTALGALICNLGICGALLHRYEP